MSSSRFIVFSALAVLLCAISLSEGMRVGPKRCCFSFSDRSVPFKQVVDYSYTNQQCPEKAVMFKTRRGRFVCAKPTDEWVQDYINKIEGVVAGSQGSL